MLALLAARKRRRRRGGRLVALPFNTQLALSTLGDETIVEVDLTTVLAEDFFAISCDLAVSVDGNTTTENPLEFGVAHGDYTVAELKEYVNANLTDPSDKIAQEHSRRLVRRFGTFSATDVNWSPNNGMEKRIPLRFSIGDGKSLIGWCMNHSGAGMNTGTIITFTGTIFGRWQI